MPTLRIGPPRDQKGSHIDMQSRANLIASINFNVNCMPEQSPAIPGISLHIGARIEKISQERNILKLNRIMGRSPRHGINSSILASTNGTPQCTAPPSSTPSREAHRA
jgi:hypothetical protein